MNRLATAIAVPAAAIFALGMSNANATIAGDTFNVETEIIDLSVGSLSLLNITVTNSGTALAPVDPDVSLVQANLVTSLLGLDLGILGVEWIDDNTFDLVFGLEAFLDLGLLTVPVDLNVVPTVNWTLSSLDWTPGRIIHNVTQIDQDFDELIGSAISWTNDSISIATNSLVAAGLAINGNSLDARVTFEIESTVIPLPASVWMMGAVGLAVGAAGYRRRKQS